MTSFGVNTSRKSDHLVRRTAEVLEACEPLALEAIWGPRGHLSWKHVLRLDVENLSRGQENNRRRSRKESTQLR